MLPRPDDDQEAKLFRSIYSEKWAAQGLATTNPEGKVIRWLPFWKDTEHFIKMINEDKKRSDEISSEKGSVEIPKDHKETTCPLNPPLPKDWVVADMFGRAIDSKTNQVCDDTSLQYLYATESFGISPQLQGLVAKAVDGMTPNSRVKLPNEFAHMLLRHAYLGQTDLRPLESPLGASTELKRCELWAEMQGEKEPLRISGETHVVANKEDMLLNDLNLKWQGYFSFDSGKKLSTLLLIGRGKATIKWPGYKPGDRLPENHSLKQISGGIPLMGGRAIDFSSEVRFGIIAPGQGKVHDPGQEGFPQGIQKKMKLLQQRIHEYQQKMMDPIVKKMKRFEEVMRHGEWAKAEEILDDALKLFGDQTKQDDNQDINPERIQKKMQSLQEKVQQWQKEGKNLEPVAKIMQNFEPLMKEVKVKEAEVLLDEVLKLFSDKK